LQACDAAGKEAFKLCKQLKDWGMLLRMKEIPRVSVSRGLRAALLGSVALAAPQAAGAQEMVHSFTNPSFGGNPFYSDHLLSIANLHRPAAPSEPSPTPEDLLAAQIRSQLTSSLSFDIVRTIQNAQPGQSGEFVVGNQVISFTRTETATRVLFTDTRTGEVSEIVIPVNAPARSPFGAAAASASAEQVLGAAGAAPLVGNPPGGSLPVTPTELPAGPPPL
jgi:curli production assembly/transport component CsgF